MTGTFFAVVGPSGAGKDTLINYAQNALTDDPRFVFPQRWITRPSDSCGENHRVIKPEQFAQMKQDGGFFLDWQAHGLSYGIPAGVTDQLADGVSAVVNISRAVIDTLCDAVEQVRIIQATAPREVIAARLATRQRETPQDIEQRLARSDFTLPAGLQVSTVCNNGSIEQAGARFVSLLTDPIRTDGHID